jgi:iron only hydrogenase large subunit-like protein
VSGVKEVKIKMGKDDLKVVVASGLADIEKLVSAIKSGQINSHFIEVMACPGGCVNGGGQPFGVHEKDMKTRAKSLYDIDEVETIKFAHKNSQVQEIYQKFLVSPGSEKAKKLLHIRYSKGKATE